MDTETFDIRFWTKHWFNLHLLCHSITVKTTVCIHGPLKASLINHFLHLDAWKPLVCFIWNRIISDVNVFGGKVKCNFGFVCYFLTRIRLQPHLCLLGGHWTHSHLMGILKQARVSLTDQPQHCWGMSRILWAIFSFQWWILANSLPVRVRITFHLINLAPVSKTIPSNKSIGCDVFVLVPSTGSVLQQFSFVNPGMLPPIYMPLGLF